LRIIERECCVWCFVNGKRKAFLSCLAFSNVFLFYEPCSTVDCFFPHKYFICDNMDKTIMIRKKIEIGLVKKGSRLPFDSSRVLRMLASAIGPRIIPRISGAGGNSIWNSINPTSPNISIKVISNVFIPIAYAPITHKAPTIGSKIAGLTFKTLTIMLDNNKPQTIKAKAATIIIADIVYVNRGNSKLSIGPGLMP
jgi:hypothetical protein